MKRGVFTVLSIDGGGVRGLIPALIVEDLMRRVRIIAGYARRHHRIVNFSFTSPKMIEDLEVDSLFDLFAGTSTGALMAIGFTAKRRYTAHEMVEIYRNHAETIFPLRQFKSLRAMRQAFAEKYDAGPFEKLLKAVFGDQKLSDCRSNLLVTSYDTDKRAPYFFKHYDETAARRAVELPEDYFLRDVARATTAAPTYFLPARVRSVSGVDRTLLDGGMVANNPALSAYVEARKIRRNARKFVIVSLGTGRNGRRFSYERVSKWGYLDWVSPILGVPMLAFMTDGQSEAAAHSLKNLPRIEYYRFNADLTAVAEEMDDASPENMELVEKMARGIIRENSKELHRLARVLYRHSIRRRRQSRSRQSRSRQSR
jgi:uncharacterized protein